MTAADHRTIIEKGADYRIDIQVSENGIDMKDVTGYSVEMNIKYQDSNDAIAVLDTIAGVLVKDVGNTIINATAIVVGSVYKIVTVGDTNFTLIGAASNTVGLEFTATGVGTGTGTVSEVTYINGNIAVVIDKAVTATYATLVAASLSPFTTEYNYFYSIDIIEDVATSAGKDNIRVLRGKLAIRE